MRSSGRHQKCLAGTVLGRFRLFWVPTSGCVGRRWLRALGWGFSALPLRPVLGEGSLSSCRAAQEYRGEVGLCLQWGKYLRTTGGGHGMAAHELVPLQEVIPGLNSLLVLPRTLPDTWPIPSAAEDMQCLPWECQA